MSAKHSSTTSAYIEWSKALDTAHRLLKDKKTYSMGLYILISIRMGLRIGDVLNLKYEDFEGDTLTIKEQKTSKSRKVEVHPEIRKALRQGQGHIFISQKGSVYSRQQINRKLKDIFKEESRADNISSHSLRKTFGRRVFEKNNESEKALVYLSQIFNHTNLGITRTYLGITQDEIKDIYLNI